MECFVNLLVPSYHGIALSLYRLILRLLGLNSFVLKKAIVYLCEFVHQSRLFVIRLHKYVLIWQELFQFCLEEFLFSADEGLFVKNQALRDVIFVSLKHI